MAERDRGKFAEDKDKSIAGSTVEGTGFVTGITLSF